jgi:formate hydrogenlyase subunit 3/multisubunit Na+/H+ antiporter MnhD subunit
MLILLALVPLVVFVVPPRWKYGVTLALAIAGIAVASAAGASVLGGFALPVPLPVHGVDRLSALFLILISVAMASVMLYARDYIRAHTGKKSAAHLSVHYASLLWMFGAMLAVVVCRTGFAFLLAWEAMTLASFLLILFEGEKREIRRAAIGYLVLMHIGFVFLLVGFVTASGDGTPGSIDAWPRYFAAHNPIPLFIVFLIGFGMKAGIFPLHIWLPQAHPAAPSHVSALMSGVMIKMGVYGILRVVAAITAGGYTVGLILLITGIATALWGIVQAALQSDLKKLLAYSSIENIGIVFIGLGAGMLGLSAGNNALALCCFTGALLHTVNHSLFKPLLFMGAGSVVMAARTRNLEDLGGLSRRMPVTTALFLIGAVAICALPPLNGFVSEFLLYAGLLRSAAAGSLVIWSVAGVAALAFAGGLAMLVFAKAFGIGFLGAPRSPQTAQATEVSRLMIAAQAIPLTGILLIGFVPAAVIPVVREVVGQALLPVPTWGGVISGDYWGISAAAGILILSVAGLSLWRRQVQRRRVIRESPTWSCGFTAPTARMEYTGESFAEGFEHIGNSTTNPRSRKNRRSGASVPKEEIFAAPHRFGVSHDDRVDRLVADRWGYVVRKINARLALFQTGKINHYILHALLFLALIFLMSWVGWI